MVQNGPNDPRGDMGQPHPRSAENMGQRVKGSLGGPNDPRGDMGQPQPRAAENMGQLVKGSLGTRAHAYLAEVAIQSCLHGGGGIWEDMCYERRRAEACVD
jgi:hypothetical protein